MHALEGVVVVDFGQYLAGPFGPMILGDLGADVIKVEPVTGDGMRMVNQPFIGCQRGKRDIGLNIKSRGGHEIALELVERADIVHHNMTAGVAKRLGIGVRRLQARQPRRRLLQHLGVRARRSARALRRPRPAVPGRGRARVRGRSGARGQQAAVHPLRHDRHRQRDALGRRLPRRALPPAPHRRGPGAVDVAARRRRDARVRRAARRRRASCRDPSSTPDQTGIDACYRLYETADGWIQIAAVKRREFDRRCARRSGCPSSLDDARFADRAARAEHRQQLEALLAPRFADADRDHLVARARRRGRAERDPASTPRPAS